MLNTEMLKAGRDLLLSLHKSFVDLERSNYENVYGPQTPGQFLNLLLEDKSFDWLRKFSMLIVEIDEMFAQKDGFDDEAVSIHLAKLRDLVQMNVDDPSLVERYTTSLEQDPGAASKQSELIALLG